MGFTERHTARQGLASALEAFMSGVIPKRTDQLIRRNIPEVPVQKVTAIGKVPIPELDIEHAHPLVIDLYQSLKDSAQNKFYEPSDWHYARLMMYAINDMLDLGYNKDTGQRYHISAVKLQVVNQMMASLMMTEGERRRARLEIERTHDGPVGTVTQISDLYRERLGAL
jgi:hypothetical protein